ncbi:hypothetical protein [Bacillus cereus]|uniref:hypothetical protein n=1 Tax=Bacillus cereus TaxID=1396 RepID=UPI0012FC642D|nr:hypothetical protein [Bacillus cereus]
MNRIELLFVLFLRRKEKEEKNVHFKASLAAKLKRNEGTKKLQRPIEIRPTLQATPDKPYNNP